MMEKMGLHKLTEHEILELNGFLYGWEPAQGEPCPQPSTTIVNYGGRSDSGKVFGAEHLQSVKNKERLKTEKLDFLRKS